MSRRAARWAKAALLLVAVAAVAEGWARSRLPASGITPFRAAAHPRLPAELRPSFSGRYTGVDVRVNAMGLRGAELLPRDPDRVRIAMVGDSFTFGSGVAEADTLPSRLAGALDARGVRAEVLNLGVPGYNVEDVADVVDSRALRPPIEADVVVYVYFGNDADPRQARADPPPDRRIDARHGFPFGSAFAQWLKLRAKTTAIRLGLDPDRSARAAKERAMEGEGGQRLARALDEMQRATASAGVPFVLVLYPFLTRPDTNPFGPVDRAFEALARERGLALVDLRPALTAEGDPHRRWTNAFDSHPDGATHGLAAEVVADALCAPGGPLRRANPRPPGVGEPGHGR